MAISERIVAYGHGYLSPSFFAVHSTANPGATAANHANYWSNNPDYAVHLVSDWNECLHTVPYDRLCWQVGNGNALCEGIEICEATTQIEFERGMAVAREAILERLTAHGWTVDDNVRSHLWFTQNYGGSDHSDPIPYLERFGWTWEKFVEYLKEDEMITKNDADLIADSVARYTLPSDDGSNDDIGNYLREIRDLCRKSADNNWRYTLPCDDGSNDDAGNYLREMRSGIRELKVILEAQSETIRTLASMQGADPDQIAKTVSEAVAKKLESIDLSVTVGE